MPDLGFNPIWIVVALSVGGALVAFGRWIGAINTDRASFKKFMEGIRNDIRELRQDIKDLLRWQDSTTIVRKSPLRLSEIGRKVSEDLNLPAMAKVIAMSVKPEVKGKLPYDIQEFCFDYIRKKYKLSATDETRIKEWAYKNGIDHDDVLDALAIVLRDELLKTEGG